jgi:hypothetical protein
MAEQAEPRERVSSLDWSEVRGHKFTPEEARDAADFGDVVRSYYLQPEELKDFVGDRKLQVGHRLYLAEMLPVDDLAPVLMGEDDDRVCAIAKTRCVENARGGRTILMPWEV